MPGRSEELPLLLRSASWAEISRKIGRITFTDPQEDLENYLYTVLKSLLLQDASFLTSKWSFMSKLRCGSLLQSHTTRHVKLPPNCLPGPAAPEEVSRKLPLNCLASWSASPSRKINEILGIDRFLTPK